MVKKKAPLAKSPVVLQTTQPSTVPLLLTPNVSWAEAGSPEAMLMYPGKEEWRKRLIHTMLEEAASGSIVDVLEFCMKYRLQDRTFFRWVKQHDDMRKAYAMMKRYIASHRRAGCIRKKYDFASAYYDIHLLDSKMLKVAEYQDNRKKKIAEADQFKGPFMIVGDSLPKPKVQTQEELDKENESIK